MPRKTDPAPPKKAKPPAPKKPAKKQAAYKAPPLYPHDYVAIAKIVQIVNNLIREYYKQEESHVPVPPEVIRAVLASPKFDPVASHNRWRAARIKAGWKGGAYNQQKKRHPNLKVAGWHELPFKERVKDWTFFAACLAAAAAMEYKNSGDDKKLRSRLDKQYKSQAKKNSRLGRAKEKIKKILK